jgi:hypothetical protein
MGEFVLSGPVAHSVDLLSNKHFESSKLLCTSIPHLLPSSGVLFPHPFQLTVCYFPSFLNSRCVICLYINHHHNVISLLLYRLVITRKKNVSTVWNPTLLATFSKLSCLLYSCVTNTHSDQNCKYYHSNWILEFLTNLAMTYT